MSKRQGKEIGQIIADVEALDWTVTETKSGYRLLAPNGVDSVGCHRGQGDPRAIKNMEAAIRRADPRFRPKK